VIKFTDLLNGLKKVLHDNFVGHTVYTEPIIEGQKRPSFSINLMPLSSNDFNDYYKEQKALVDISYYSSEGADLQSNLSNLTMINLQETAFNGGLTVLDRVFRLEGLSFNIVERVLHSTFTIIWYNVNEATQTYLDEHENMQEVTISSVNVSND